MVTTAPSTHGKYASSAPAHRAGADGDADQVEFDDPDVHDEDELEDDPDEEGPSERVWFASACLTLLGVLLIAFVVQLLLVTDLEHSRAQRIGYAELRNQLAQGTAPVGGRRDTGEPLALGAPVAVIEIPSIGVKEVVGYGTTSDVLAKGPGLRRDTVFPGDPGTSIVMGRRAAYGGPFKRLASLRVGSRIVVTTGQGVQTFAVLDVRLAGDLGPPAPAANEGRLILMTATGAAYVPGGILRVDARLTSPPVQGLRPTVASAALPSDEKALNGQPSAWLAVVLWGQGLLLAVLAAVWMRSRLGLWQAWVIGLPVVTGLAMAVCDAVIKLLPNLL